MNSDLLLDFSVNKESKTVYIEREFNAGLDLVWEVWTTAELLDQWWGPKPLIAKTKFMNFEVGGRRFYAMVSPEGQERWSVQKFTSISPKTNFKTSNVFTDKDENPEFIGSEWDFTFSEQNGITKVSITVFNESLARMEKMIEMGTLKGCALQFKNLDELLEKLKKS